MANGPIMRYGDGFKEMSEPDLRYVRYVIKKHYFDSGEEAGTLRINSAPDASWISIGQATDYVKSSGTLIVTEDIDGQSVNVPYIPDGESATYTFYQKRGSYPEPSLAKEIKDKFPLFINGSVWSPGTETHVAYQARVAALSLVDSYYLAAQSAVSGFSSTGYSLSDRVVVPGTATTNTTVYNLFRKTTETVPTVIRPLKIRYDQPVAQFQEMSDQDIIDVYYPYFQWMLSDVGLPLFKFGTVASITYTGYNRIRGEYVENYYTDSSTQSVTPEYQSHTYFRNASSLRVTRYYLGGKIPS